MILMSSPYHHRNPMMLSYVEKVLHKFYLLVVSLIYIYIYINSDFVNVFSHGYGSNKPCIPNLITMAISKRDGEVIFCTH